MGRPLKQTVEFFPHMSGASNGKTLYVLENQFGNDGYAFWFKLLELLAQSQSHSFCYHKPSDWQFLLAKTRVKAETAQAILQTLADVDAIDSDLHKHCIIWSQNFVDNLEPLYARRKGTLPQKPFPPTTPLLVDYSRVEESRVEETPLNANNNPFNVVNKGVNVKNTPQKVKSSDDYVNNKFRKKAVKTVYGEFQNVLLSDEEHQKLVDKFNEPDTKERIERLSGYKKSKGVSYKDDYATILNWSRKDIQEGRNNGGTGNGRTNSTADVSGIKNRTAELKAGWK